MKWLVWWLVHDCFKRPRLPLSAVLHFIPKVGAQIQLLAFGKQMLSFLWWWSRTGRWIPVEIKLLIKERTLQTFIQPPAHQWDLGTFPLSWAHTLHWVWLMGKRLPAYRRDGWLSSGLCLRSAAHHGPQSKPSCLDLALCATLQHDLRASLQH